LRPGAEVVPAPADQISLDPVWHAAVGRAQAWASWASGIVLGAAALTLFALFAERRNDVLRVLDAARRSR
jgi:hypothetical protein